VAKHLLVVHGRTIFERQVSLLSPRVAEILISSRDDIEGYRSVRDRHEGIGPLAGIAAGLAVCTTPWLLVIAGDMPNLTGELIDQLLAMRSGDAACIRIDGLPEPLVCLLHSRVQRAIDHRIATGRYKVSGLFTEEGLDVRWLDDADPQALRNVNSPEDL
jgi:molybdopterin-guanine dinucleotide biosynthesis protein A